MTKHIPPRDPSLRQRPAVPRRLLPAPETLNSLQLTEQRCALCNQPLLRDRYLGTVLYAERGEMVKADLWGCAPAC